MTDKELRKLKRAELLELLVAQSKEMDKLKEELQKTQEKLEEKELRIAESGSIAEAAVTLTNVFAEAQKAADVYLDNIRRMERQKREQMEKEGYTVSDGGDGYE